MENKVGEYHFTIRPFEVDFRNKLTLPLLINYLLNVAGYHADARGFGMEKINKDNRSWVLSRIAIELYKYPINNDEIMIQTWVENVMKMFTLRNFAIIGKNNEIYGYAKTVWAMIDTETRKPVSLIDEKINSFICDKECPIERTVKFAAPQSESFLCENFKVKYSDIDINKHLNSSKYVEYIVDAFSLQEFNDKDISRLETEFVEECLFGEEISIFKTEISKQEYLIDLKNNEGKTVCKSKVRFNSTAAKQDS